MLVLGSVSETFCHENLHLYFYSPKFSQFAPARRQVHPKGKDFLSNPRCFRVRAVSFREGTPPKINMEHNNGGLEDDFPFQIGDF